MKRFSVLLISMFLLILVSLYGLSVADKKQRHSTISISSPVRQITNTYSLSTEVLNWFF